MVFPGSFRQFDTNLRDENGAVIEGRETVTESRLQTLGLEVVTVVFTALVSVKPSIMMR